MMFVALKMLVGDRLKYLGLVVGLAFAAMLITQQASILVGLAHQTGSFVRDTSQADLWVMDPEVRFSQDSLALQDTVLQRVRGVAGVEWAVPMYQGFLRAKLPDGSQQLCILVGLDDATLMGGPPTMVQGRLADLRQNAGILIDEDARKTKMRMRRGGDRGLEVGDRLTINDQDARVVGTYRASKSFFWEPVVYTTYTRALRYAPRERKLLTYVMVKLRPGADAAGVAAEIEQATSLKARTNEQFAEITANYILKETGILVNFGLAVGLGFVIGALVAGQMLYNFTLDNIRHFGALKAMGAGNGTLVAMVAVQSLTVGALGYGVGIGMGSLLGKIVGDAGLAFRMPWQIPVFSAGAILLMCLLAGVLSSVRVLRQEAAVVFRG
ncbi:MAG: ABC transporter permease [Planctomycetes bacterium]|nr:ABC transporter permease [Planctomycetota bacterium]